MNIFYLSDDPVTSAQSMVDRHVVKMILETAQLLCTAHRVLDGERKTVVGKRKTTIFELNGIQDELFYKATHVNHPCAVWVRHCPENYNWTYRHYLALLDEYTYRYGKTHATKDRLGLFLEYPPQKIISVNPTLPPSCMNNQFIISDDPVLNYRNYYNYGKTHLLRWTKRIPPNWINYPIKKHPDKEIYTI